MEQLLHEHVQTCAARYKALPTCLVENGDFSIDSGLVLGERLLEKKDPPTAIFCLNDEMAMGVIETAKRHGLRVPMDLSVLGFDDIRFARCMDPPLTTIAQPMREIGERTVRLLVEILSGRATPFQSITLPHMLIVRSSTAPPCVFSPGRTRGTSPAQNRRFRAN